MNIRKCAFLTAAVLVVLAIACGKNGLGGLIGIFIPDFSNNWRVEKGQPDELFFFSKVTYTTADSTTGTFEGKIDNLNFSGTFSSPNVSLTILANPTDSTFTGKYDDLASPKALRLRNDKTPFDSLVLRRL